MIIREAVGMDDNAFENEDDAEGGGGEGKEEDHPFYTLARTNRSILTRFIISQEAAEKGRYSY